MKELVTCYKIPLAIQKLYVLNDNARLKFIIFDIIVLNSSTLSIRISHCIYACVRACESWTTRPKHCPYIPVFNVCETVQIFYLYYSL